MKALIASLLMLGIAVSPSHAQGTTAEDVSRAFVQAVALCAKAAVTGGGIATLPAADRASVTPGNESARNMLKAAATASVWSVKPAEGIVAIAEATPGACDIIGYGPRVVPVFDEVGKALTAADLQFAQVPAESTPSSIIRRYQRMIDGRTVNIQLDGGEPGMPGRLFRFPMLQALVVSKVSAP